MCGIVGLFGRFSPPDNLRGLVEGMADRLVHRGPDDRDVWWDPESFIALGHTRLSILDPSPAGRQPMESACGRYMIVFNGEIFNFKDLRAELESKGRGFSGTSDTEVLLAAVSEWGVASAIRKTTGMFAIAIWDRLTNRLHMIRDRFGEKPLYYARIGKSVGFASELKPFHQVPGFNRSISRPGLAMLMRFNYIPSSHCIFENVHKVKPGEIVTFALVDGSVEKVETIRYWNMDAVVRYGRENPFRGDFREAVDRLRHILEAAVARQMVADVPIGSFLSGGVDSSLITALMQRQSSRKAATFSIGVDWAGLNESEYAAKVAAYLGTEHTDFVVSGKDALAIIPKLPEIYDEPFADSSQLPTFLLCQLARKQVTVALTGDGADELFFGYSRYFQGMRIWSKLNQVPLAARKALSMARAVPSMWEPVGMSKSPGAAPGFLKRSCEQYRKRALYACELYGSAKERDFYLNLVSQERRPDCIIEEGEPSMGDWSEDVRLPGVSGLADLMMYFDTVQYLPDDILVKVDRAGMSVGLETRIPFLDHTLCEFAWTLPLEYMQAGGSGKRILKHLLAEYVPRELTDRPKSGFGVPIVNWLRTDLRDWAESLMDRNKLRDAGFKNPDRLIKDWRWFQEGNVDSRFNPWSVLIFRSWQEANRL